MFMGGRQMFMEETSKPQRVGDTLTRLATYFRQYAVLSRLPR
jgi:hypothetical protein